MDFSQQNSNDQSAIGTSTAFRLPTTLLRTIDAYCTQHDVTRSQFYRKSIIERIKALDLDISMARPQQSEERQWSQHLYDRLQRRR